MPEKFVSADIYETVVTYLFRAQALCSWEDWHMSIEKVEKNRRRTARHKLALVLQIFPGKTTMIEAA